MCYCYIVFVIDLKLFGLGIGDLVQYPAPRKSENDQSLL